MRRFLPIGGVVCALVLCGCPSDSAKTGAQGAKDGGASRIAIKHGNDPDAAKIDTTPKDLSVEDLLSMKLPDDVKGDLSEYANSRIGEFEKSTYRVQGTLKSVVHRKDGDYYLVMEGKTGAQAVIEVPDPKFCKDSPIIDKITAARNEIEAKYHPTDTPKEINQPATIEGVGFYGWKGRPGSGGHGSAPRIMPGTGFHEGKAG